ncbi:Forkhead box protein P1 [Nymphon striatum]|nr:Forkhead box protein P1 [Nymphon striatum]
MNNGIFFFALLQNDGKMLTMDNDEESAINLSTSTAISNGSPEESTATENTISTTADIERLLAVNKAMMMSSSSINGKSNNNNLCNPTSALENNSMSGNSSTTPPIMLLNPQQLMAQQQQMSQLLQHQVLASPQLQSLMQQQSFFMQQQLQQHQQQQQLQELSRKQLESIIPQLQEQLQLNIQKQTQIMPQLTGATSKQNPNKVQAQLQQLHAQQQQLVQQLQMLQRHYVLTLPSVMSQGFPDIQGICSSNGSGGNNIIEESFNKNNLNGLLNNRAFTPPDSNSLPAPAASLLGHRSQNQTNGLLNDCFGNQSSHVNTGTDENQSASTNTHPLLGHGVCKWPGCEFVCDSYDAFIKHLNSEHQLDDRSTAQARVQMQVVSQLDLQLNKERDRLQAMMAHLHMKPNSSAGGTSGPSSLSSSASSPASPEHHSHHHHHLHHHSVRSDSQQALLRQQHSPPHASIPSQLLMKPTIPNLTAVSTMSQALSITSNNLTNSSPSIGPPPPLSLPGTIPTESSIPSPTLGGALLATSVSNTPDHLSISRDISCSIDMSVDSTIRRRVAERANLDISEEINRNRDFYRNADVRPPFTYASLIRQGIIESPEKQLTLNEIYNWFQNTFAYFRRNAATWKVRLMSLFIFNLAVGKFSHSVLFAAIQNAVRHNLSLHKCFMRVENVKGAVWTVDEVEFYKRRPQRVSGNSQSSQSKSPTLQQSPTLYGESLNASLQAALAESNYNFLNNNQPINDDSGSGALSPSSITNTINGFQTNTGGSSMAEAERLVQAVINQAVNNDRACQDERDRVLVKKEPTVSEEEQDMDNLGSDEFDEEDERLEESNDFDGEAEDLRVP